MKSFTAIAACAFSLFQLSTASAIPILHKRMTSPPLPQDDPFHVAPSGYETSAPGTILRSRTLNDFSFSGIIPLKVQAAYQLLFRTTDSIGNPQAAISTIMVPENANMSRLLSYQTAEDSAWDGCAPSYTLRLRSDLVNGGSLAGELLLIIAALNEGYVVSIPDYEGPESAYTSGIQAGQATLDSVRAALASGSITNVSSAAEYQMWGYSGGALASEWAAELQPTYAPELHFIGTVLGGLIPNVQNVLNTINKGPFAGLVATGFNGLANGYPEIQTYLNQHLIPSKSAAFKKPLTQCLAEDAIQFVFKDIYKFFDNGKDFINAPVVQTVLNETGIMGQHGTPQMPLFIHKAVADEVSPVADTDALVKQLCSQGARIQYTRDLIGEHVTESITGSGDALNFIKARFNGVPALNGCKTRTVITNLADIGAAAGMGSALIGALLALLQIPIGASKLPSVIGSFFL
ncbi:secretory lipase-like protein 1 precursor [Aureobasidium pullulans]|uniref:Secretory lipase-like protein 1 n=1 Tax=Aureobasidium pullulans TaxID=5580 RepID=A0A4S9L6K1_AURPU|nr:secretory lipase-like protein 1 precursor [Aureobasidium pullulans]